MGYKIKQVSTGDNDSVEDALISIMNIKTEDGKFLDMKEQTKAVIQQLKILNMFEDLS